MMVRTRSLRTMGTVHVPLLLLLSPAMHSFLFNYMGKPSSPFDPSQYVWKDASFTVPKKNKAVVILHNVSEAKMQVLSWSEPLLHLPRGSPFSGFIYFRAQTPEQMDIQYFANGTQGRFFHPASPYDYCVAINTAENLIQQLPGFTGEFLQSKCVPCNSEDCPFLFLPCHCGWLRATQPSADRKKKLPKIHLVGVTWWDPSEFKETPSTIRDGRKLSERESVEEAQGRKFKLQRHPNP